MLKQAIHLYVIRVCVREKISLLVRFDADTDRALIRIRANTRQFISCYHNDNDVSSTKYLIM